MKPNKTAKKIIKIIIENNIENPGVKQNIGEIAEQAGVSRQSISRYYKDLIPYIKAEKPSNDLNKYLDSMDDEFSNNLLAQCQTKNTELNNDLITLRTTYNKDIKDVKYNYITSLMNNDIAIHESDEIRISLEKQSLLNDELTRKIKSLESDLTKEKSKLLQINELNKHSISPACKIISIEEDIKPIFDLLNKTQDIDVFEDGKENFISNILERINKIGCKNQVRIILFIDRYLTKYKNFVNEYKCTNDEPHIIVRLPLFSRTDIKLFIKSIDLKGSIIGYIPYSKSESITKAQRGFIFKDVPNFELEQADRFNALSLDDGFDEIIMYSVTQGI